MMIFANRHRSGVICDENRMSENYFGMRGRGLPHWWVLPLEMLSTCTCYTRLHWRWFGYVSPSYCTTWPSLILARFRFLLDHMSGPFLFHMSVFYWHTYRVAIGSRVTSSLDQVSYFYWSMWRDHNTPHVFLLLDHVSRCCTSAC